MKQTPTETEKNIERYISRLTEKIFNTIDEVHNQSLQYMHNELRKVQQILFNSTNNADEIQQKITRLHEMMKDFPELNPDTSESNL